jgi:N-acetylglucosaminyl-diphospho-decaprenol L-rhamnosyltransferase
VIHVVVVAYRSAGYIRACLQPLLDDDLVTSVVVIDNSSDAATEQACRRWASDERFEYLPSANIGYAAACNLGLARAKGLPRYVAIVNPDVALARPLSELAAHADRTGGSVFAARLNETAGANARHMVSPLREVLNAAFGSRVYELRGLRRHPQRAEFVRVPQIDGSLLLIPAAEAQALGGFDERYELYYEDVDYCRRANERGGCHLWMEVWGSHQGGASSSTAGEPPFVTLRVSRARFLRKWHGPLGLPLSLLVAWLDALVRGATGRAPSRRAVVRGLVAQLREVLQPGTCLYLDGRAIDTALPRTSDNRDASGPKHLRNPHAEVELGAHSLIGFPVRSDMTQ